MLPAALARRSSRRTLPSAVLAAGRGRAFLGSGSLTGSLLGDKRKSHRRARYVVVLCCGYFSLGLPVWLPQLRAAQRPEATCNRSGGQSITNSVKGTRTEATMYVVAETRTFQCKPSGRPGGPSRLKVGRAPAGRQKGKA